MHFKVYAGNMLCGMLYVTAHGNDFRDTNGIKSDNIFNYSNLHLVKCTKHGQRAF